VTDPISIFGTPSKRTKRKPFNLHNFLIRVEVAAFYIAATIIVLVWLYHHLMHEIGR